MYDKKEMKQYRTGKLRIYLVNGTAVRKDHIMYVMGGHWRVYEWMPKNEVWIAEELNTLDRKYTLLHELRELWKMIQGMDYSTAHNHYANVIEGMARNGGDIDEMLEKELEKFEPKIVKPLEINSSANGRKMVHRVNRRNKNKSRYSLNKIRKV